MIPLSPLSPEEKILDEIIAYGHENVLGTHPTTLEFTTEPFLTKRGDCILGINGNKGCAGLSTVLRSQIQAGKQIRVEIIAGEFNDSFLGYGNPELKLNNPMSVVFRKSDFISDRTILIKCSKAAKDINPSIAQYLKNPKNQVLIRFYGQV